MNNKIMDEKTNQRFMDMLMEKICEKYYHSKSNDKNNAIYNFDIDEFIREISHPSDPEEAGIDIEGWGQIISKKTFFRHYKWKEK